MWCCWFVTVAVLLLTSGAHSADEEAIDSSRSSRELTQDDFRAVDSEKWRAIEYQVPDNQDWMPADGSISSSLPTAEEEPVLKRRRPGRKRKRRPQNFDREYQNEDDPYTDRLPARPRPRRPQRLDQWRDEMLAEEPFRPMRNYNRRRLYPKYEEEAAKTEEKDAYDDESKGEDIELRASQSIQITQENDDRKTETVTEKIRDPFTALNQEQTNRRRPYSKRKYANKDEDEEQVQTTDMPDSMSSNSLDLKTLLKQSGGISLSELLQQKNLTLADLLKDDEDDKPKRYNANSNNRRLPPIRKYTKQNEYNDDDSEFTTIKENLLLQKKRTSANTDNKQNIPLFNSAEPIDITTDHRIFVPSHPKYYTSVDYKPNIKELHIDKTTESFSTTTAPLSEKTSESFSIISSTVTFSTSENPTTVRSKNHFKVRPLNTLPPTLAKLKNLAAKTTMKSVVNSETENYPKLPSIPPKAFKINLNELFGVTKPYISTQSPTTEGPMKISVNINQLFQTPEKNEPDSNLVITENNKVKNKYVKEEREKIVALSAKDEIMEVLSDSTSRENLTRLLKLRNMTVEELVAQRERGSSQKHLADIFHNQTKEPEPAEEIVVSQIMKDSPSDYKSSVVDPPSLFETFPVFKQRPNINIPSDETEYYTSVIELPSKTRESRQNQLSTKELDDYNFIGNPLFGTTTAKSNDIYGVWSQAYTKVNKHNKQPLLEKVMEDELIITDEAQRIEEIENRLAEAVNGALNIDVNNQKPYIEKLEEENEFFRLPYGVRSAVVASAIIVGISLLVFLTIFIIFKWTQRQRKQLVYGNNFSSSKIKSPILESQYQGRIFENIVNATLGRKKRINTISTNSEPHSLQDYLWDNDRKPFQ
ncbi:uncharacterized protein CBL_01512 [Carabus blaptoides fortunei]